MPLFISDEGRALAPTARAVWDRVIDLDGSAPLISDTSITGDDAATAYDQASTAAQEHGRALFTELMDEHQKRQARKRQKGRRAFDARRRAIERIGLPQVRDFRLRELAQEEREWTEQITAQDTALPELTALLVVRIASVEEAR